MKVRNIINYEVELNEAVYTMLDGRSFTKYDLEFDYTSDVLNLDVAERYGNIDKTREAVKIFKPLQDEIFSHGNDTVKVIFYEDLLSEVKDAHLTVKAPRLRAGDDRRLAKMVICADIRTDSKGKILVTPTMFPQLDPKLGKFAVVYRVNREKLENVLYHNWLTSDKDSLFASFNKKALSLTRKITNPDNEKLKKLLVSKIIEFSNEIFFNTTSGVICVFNCVEANNDAHRIDAKTIVYPAIRSSDLTDAKNASKNSKTDTDSDEVDVSGKGIMSKIYASIATELSKSKANLPAWFVDYIEKNQKVPMDVKNSDPKYKELVNFERQVSDMAKKLVQSVRK